MCDTWTKQILTGAADDPRPGSGYPDRALRKVLEPSQQIQVNVMGSLWVSQRTRADHVEHKANFRKELIKAMTK